jgi:type VI secretion system secreted protein VgrG
MGQGAGDASMFITGKLTEMIEGDVHSETKKGKTVVNNEKGIEANSNSSITKHAQTVELLPLLGHNSYTL